MIDLNTTDYYRSREQQERELAEAATSPAISGIHLDMARRYSELISNTMPQIEARQ